MAVGTTEKHRPPSSHGERSQPRLPGMPAVISGYPRVLELQRLIGNAAVARMVGHRPSFSALSNRHEPPVPVQRFIADEKSKQGPTSDRRPIIADRNGHVDLWVKSLHPHVKGIVEEKDFSELLKDDKFGGPLVAMIGSDREYPVEDFVKALSVASEDARRVQDFLNRTRHMNAQARHAEFLKGFNPTAKGRAGGLLNQHLQAGRALVPHEETLRAAPKGVTNPYLHYKAADSLFENKQYIWRFTSKPAEEQVYLGPKALPEEVLSVVSKHSGGNDKSNREVMTLSFGRNIAALYGVSRSKGGDKNVKRIIEQAAFLYGIDISTLAEKGITAHPAHGRGISAFETEYVLVGTPGAPAQSLEELATVKSRNPFRVSPSKEEREGMDKKQTELLEQTDELSKTKEVAAVFNEKNVGDLQKLSTGYEAAATAQSGQVQAKDEEGTDFPIVVAAMAQYHQKLKELNVLPKS